MKETKPHMSESENKLAGLKECLARENAWVKHHTDSAEQIKAQIKELEEALAPKQGDIYENVNTSLEYILARVAHRKYSLINLQTGERYMDGAEDMDEVFGNNSENFVKIKR